jgi:hypothetical protein
MNSTEYMYLVIGGPVRYHSDDPEITEIFGLFTEENEARHCHKFHKDSCGELKLIKVPVNKHLLDFELELSDGEDDPPEPTGECEVYKNFYVVLIKNTLFGAFYNKNLASKMKEQPDKKFNKDESFKLQFVELMGKWPHQYYPELRCYKIIDLHKFDFDNSIIDIEFEPIKLTKIPGYYR